MIRKAIIGLLALIVSVGVSAQGVLEPVDGFIDRDGRFGAERNRLEGLLTGISAGNIAPNVLPLYRQAIENYTGTLTVQNGVYQNYGNGTLKASAPECQTLKPLMFYLNGLGTGLAAIKNNVNYFQQEFPEFEVRPALVTSHGHLLDFAEAAEQRMMATCNSIGTTDLKDIWQTIGRALRLDIDPRQLTNLPACIRNSIVDAIRSGEVAIYESFLEEQEDLPEHVALYEQAVDEGRPFVLMGYSQGSLYSNFGYDAITARHPNHSIGVYQVGSVADTVRGISSGVGDYTTLNGDVLVNAIRLVYPDTLPGNLDYDAGGLNHRFNHYFNNAIPFEKIRKDVQRVVANLESQPCDPDTPPPEPEPVPLSCGEPISAEGSTGRTVKNIDLGNRGGSVELEFEAYRIPDSLEIRDSMGEVIYSTDGQVTGFHKTSLYFPGRADGRSEIWEAVVEGNPDPGTKWNLVVGCPGESITNSDRPNQRGVINVRYGVDNTVIVNNQTCAIQLSINGVEFFNQPFQAGSINASVEITRGHTHDLTWVADCKTNCQTSQCNYWNQNELRSGFGANVIGKLPNPIFSPVGRYIFDC